MRRSIVKHPSWTLEVCKQQLAHSRLQHAATPSPAEGQLCVQVEQLALTANTMTYAALGDALGYWSLFPASAPGWGRIPAWGHGRVVESKVEGLSAGQRLFGLFPMASQLVLQGRRSRLGLRETSPHRLVLNPIYNQ